MSLYLSLIITILTSVGTYCLLQPHLARVIAGILLLTESAHLILLTVGGLEGRAPPLVLRGERVLAAPAADAVPQFLILTSMLVSLAVVVFFLSVARDYFRAHQSATITPEADA